LLKKVALQEVFNKLVDNVSDFISGGGSEVEGLEHERELDDIKQEVKNSIDLNVDEISYIKEPKEEQGVIAIFHELIGAGILKGYHTLRSSAREAYDSFVRYKIDKSELPSGAQDRIGKKPVDYEFFVEFKYEASKLLPDLDERKRARDIKLLVCWQIDTSKFENENIDVDDLDWETGDSIYYGATHLLTFSRRYQFGAENQLHVICLKTFLEHLRHRNRK
jgi:hypothetical protein